MKKIVFKEGTFVDFKGNKREYTMCAISLPISETDDNAGNDEVKQLRLGIAVRREGDEYVRGIGMTEAERKAMENPFNIIRSTTVGVINQEVVESILNQEGKFFEANPGKYLATYSADKMNWEDEQKVKEIYKSLPEEAKKVHEYLVTASDEVLKDLAICVTWSCSQNEKGEL